jgi:hypothetical protein
MTENQRVEYKCRWQLPLDLAVPVTHLAWSPWIDLPSSTLSPPQFNKASILAASAVDGSVNLAFILTSTASGDIEIYAVDAELQPVYSRTLLPKHRMAATKLFWTTRRDDIILAIARNGILSLSIHHRKTDDILSSKVMSCRHTNYSPAVGIPSTC